MYSQGCCCSPGIEMSHQSTNRTISHRHCGADYWFLSSGSAQLVLPIGVPVEIEVQAMKTEASQLNVNREEGGEKNSDTKPSTYCSDK